jgi:nitrogen fixation NifU-like protein
MEGVKLESFDYNKKVLDHFRHPRNMGEIKNADGIGKVGNPVCGDIMMMTIKVAERQKGKGKKEKYIKDIKFKTLGCGAAIATASVITTLAKGKSLEQAKKITNLDVQKVLGGLPPLKRHCSNLAEEVLKSAIADFERRGHAGHHRGRGIRD